MSMTVEALADWLGGEVIGDPTLVVEKVQSLSKAGPNRSLFSLVIEAIFSSKGRPPPRFWSTANCRRRSKPPATRRPLFSSTIPKTLFWP